MLRFSVGDESRGQKIAAFCYIHSLYMPVAFFAELRCEIQVVDRPTRSYFSYCCIRGRLQRMTFRCTLEDARRSLPTTFSLTVN